MIHQTMLIMLQAAVPLHAARMAWVPWSEIERIAADAAISIAERGDVLEFGGGKPGEAGGAFNKLAIGLAALSFAPGGVTFEGVHFQHEHEGPRAPGRSVEP